MYVLRRRPSPAMVVALIALFVALGGSSYAVVKLGRNAVKAQNIAPNAVTSSKVKDHSLRTGDFKPGEIPSGAQGPAGATGAQGAKGDTGATGATGAPGTALAYASIAASGMVDPSRSKNIAQSNVTLAGDYYCFHDLGFTPKNVVAATESLDRTVHVVGLDFDFVGCGGDEDFAIGIRDLTPAAAVGQFFVLVN